MTSDHKHPDEAAVAGAGDDAGARARPRSGRSPARAGPHRGARARARLVPRSPATAGGRLRQLQEAPGAACRAADGAGRRAHPALAPARARRPRALARRAREGGRRGVAAPRRGTDRAAHCATCLLARAWPRSRPRARSFDPREHEALVAQPTAEVAEGTVLAVVQAGWRLGEHVLRPARVVVATAAEGGER